jgi:transposase
MDRFVERCAGLDVHKDSVAATVRVPGEEGQRLQETRTFSTTTGGLVTLADWLSGYGVTLVGMESTGCYWKPVYYLLEEHFECWLLNAQHLRKVPGRKTDVADSSWICQLVEHGLVRASFVPPKPIRELRDLTRYRKTQIEERSREVQRLDKVLQDAGIKLSSVASETLGVSVRRMLDAFVAGTHDPEVLAELAKGRLRRKLPALREALTGRFRSEHHGLLVSQILAHVDYLDETIAFLSARIEQVIAPFSQERELLETIPGVARTAAQVLIAEIGVDMSVFPSDAHLASWAGQCPGNHESAGKRRSRQTTPGLQMAPDDTERVGEKPPRVARAPTSAPSINACAEGAAPARQPALCATRSSSPPTTSSSARSPTKNSAPTTSTSAARSNTARNGSSANSNSSATQSPSSRSRRKRCPHAPTDHGAAPREDFHPNATLGRCRPRRNCGDDRPLDMRRPQRQPECSRSSVEPNGRL